MRNPTVAHDILQLKRTVDPSIVTRTLEHSYKVSLQKAGEIKKYHDLLLYHCAYPHDGHIYKLAIEELGRVADATKKLMARKGIANQLALMGTGLPHTDLLCNYSFSLTQWLVNSFPGQVILDSSEAEPEAIRNILYLFLPKTSYKEVHEGDLHLQARIKLITNLKDPGAQLKWLIGIFEQSSLPLEVKEEFYNQLRVYVRWQLADDLFNRSFLHAPVDHLYYFHQFMKVPSVNRILKQETGMSLDLDDSMRRKLVALMKATLAFQYREIDPVTYADEQTLEYFDLGRGLRIALVGMIREKKLSVEDYIGYMAFRNGVPVAYGGGWLYKNQCRIGINIFSQFRRGESSWLFCQVLRLYRQRFNSRHFTVKPYQFGKKNHEGLRTGAFWFYYKLGFRPVDKSIRQLAQEEWKLKENVPGHRTSIARLRKLASCFLEKRTR